VYEYAWPGASCARGRWAAVGERCTREFLNDLRYEDDQQLHELVGLLDYMCPNVSLDLKIDLARTIVFGLLADNLVQLVHGPWPEYGPALTATDLERLRHEDAPWHDPEATDLRVEVRSIASA